ncbi:thioredoxin-like domain-containing protein [Akkermansiaceae bacterium]|nr:thioredoxin-like domain-containing protein [Akkermansiaceae bacterium]
MKKLLLGLTAILISAQCIYADGGIKGQKAPEILVDEWVNIPKGEEIPNKKNLAGKVVYLYCYQSWCPGCHSSGFPTLQKVSEEFKDSENVEFLVVQTVFEGFSTNSPEKWQGIAEKFHLTHLRFGHSGSEEKPSKLMRNFKTRGTPWVIIIGKDGNVEYNAFHIKPDSAVALMKKLEAE